VNQIAQGIGYLCLGSACVIVLAALVDWTRRKWKAKRQVRQNLKEWDARRARIAARWQAWVETHGDSCMDVPAFESTMDALEADDFPRPMGVKPPRQGYILESRRFVPGATNAEIVTNLLRECGG
jgi:hypothetical protein